MFFRKKIKKIQLFIKIIKTNFRKIKFFFKVIKKKARNAYC